MTVFCLTSYLKNLTAHIPILKQPLMKDQQASGWSSVLSGALTIAFSAAAQYETEMIQPLTHPLRSASGTCCPLLTSNNLMDRSDEHVASLVP